jgi:hypothetical protein
MAEPIESVWPGLFRSLRSLRCHLYEAPDFLIVGDFPALLGEFCQKRFTLLWRGGRL